MNTSSVHRPVLMLIWARWDPLAEESVWECASNRGRVQRWSSLQEREELAGSVGSGPALEGICGSKSLHPVAVPGR